METTKPLVSLDIETTGTDKNRDRIIQFAAIKIDTTHHKIIDSINMLIRPDGDYVMSIGAYLKHRIHPDMLKDKPTFKEVAKQIYDFIGNNDILTYNGVSFDLPFLMNEFKRAGITFLPSDHDCYDSYKEEVKRHSNKLGDTFERYCGRTMEQAGLTAHDAFSDVKACYAIYRHQNETDDISPDPMWTDDNMIVMDNIDGNIVPVINFGRYRDVPVSMVKAVDPSYITWMLSSGVCEKTRKILTEI